MDKAELPRYQRMAQALRQAGIRAEMYLGTAGMKAQMKYADKRGAPCVVIQGGDERAKGEVQIKDLVEGAKAAATIKDTKEWREGRPAQFSVPEDNLIASRARSPRAPRGLSDHARTDRRRPARPRCHAIPEQAARTGCVGTTPDHRHRIRRRAETLAAMPPRPHRSSRPSGPGAAPDGAFTRAGYEHVAPDDHPAGRHVPRRRRRDRCARAPTCSPIPTARSCACVPTSPCRPAGCIWRATAAATMPARYCYNGSAFRYQPGGAMPAHPREFRQAGIESFARRRPRAGRRGGAGPDRRGRCATRALPACRLRIGDLACSTRCSRSADAGALASPAAAPVLATRGVSRRAQAA